MTQAPVQQTPPPEDIQHLLNSTSVGQHLMLGEFVLPFAPNEEDPTGQTEVSNGFTQLWLDGQTLRLSVYSRTLGRWTNIPDEPVGTFKGFVGAESDIPYGWHVCDGTGGTPDFRGFFIMGSSLADAGEYNTEQTLIIANHSDVLTSGPPNELRSVTDDGTNQIDVGSLAHGHESLAAIEHTVSQAYSPPFYKAAIIMKVL